MSRSQTVVRCPTTTVLYLLEAATFTLSRMSEHWKIFVWECSLPNSDFEETHSEKPHKGSQENITVNRHVSLLFVIKTSSESYWTQLPRF